MRTSKFFVFLMAIAIVVLASTSVLAQEPTTVDPAVPDFYATQEQAAIGAEILESVMPGLGGFDAAAMAADAENYLLPNEEAFDPTRWGDCFALGIHFPEGADHERQRGDEWFRIAEVANRIEDTDGDYLFELIPAEEVYTTHAILFGRFSGIEVPPCTLQFPNELRMTIVEDADGNLPEQVSFTVVRDRFSAEALGDDPWNVLSENTGIVILQVGSLMGADVVVQVDGQIAAYRVVGEYCDLCTADTTLLGGIGQYQFEAQDYAFEDGADVTTEDVLTLEVPVDFSEVRVTITNIQGQVPGAPAVSVWFGSGNPETEFTAMAAEDVVAVGDSVTVTANGLNVRATPVNGAVVTSVKGGTVVEVQEIDAASGWFKVTVNGQTGWITNDELYVSK